VGLVLESDDQHQPEFRSVAGEEIGDVGGRVLIGDGLFPRAGKYKTVFRSLLWWRRYGAVFESSTMSKSKETIFFRFLV